MIRRLTAQGCQLIIDMRRHDWMRRAQHKPVRFQLVQRLRQHPLADPAALKGVDTLVLISSNDFTDRAGQHRKVIAAAKAAGVGRIV